MNHGALLADTGAPRIARFPYIPEFFLFPVICIRGICGICVFFFWRIQSVFFLTLTGQYECIMIVSPLVVTAENALKSHDYAAAEAAYREILADSAYASDASVWHALGDVLATGQKYYEAIDAYSSAMQLDPENPGYMADLGESLATVHEYEEAKIWFEKAARLSDTIRYQFKVGDMLGYLGKYDEALVFYTLLSSRYPDEPDLLRRKARVLQHLGRKADMLKVLTEEVALRKAVIARDQDAESHYQLGKTYAMSLLWYEAEEELAAAVRMDGGNPEYFRKYGVALIMNKRVCEGLAAFDTAAALAQTNFLFLIGLAETLVKLHRYEDSIRFYTQALAVHNVCGDAWTGIAYSLLMEDRREEARAFWEMAKAADCVRGLPWVDKVHKSAKTEALDSAFPPEMSSRSCTRC